MTFILTHTGIPIKKDNTKKYISHTKNIHTQKIYRDTNPDMNPRYLSSVMYF